MTNAPAVAAVPHLAPLIHDLAIILGVAGLMTLLFRWIRQPVVLGYIIAGIAVGPHTPPFRMVTDIPSIRVWAELGVIFLMFTLGLEFSFRKLARLGTSAVVTASCELLFFLPVGYAVGRALLGWSPMDSLFLAAMITISSTTIIMKALDELKFKKHRFAELILGVLIAEDLFAILLLVALGTTAASQTVSVVGLLSAALKLVLVVGGWFLAGYFVVPRFMRLVGRVGSDELLTIFSLGLCLALVVVADRFKYSTALGAFIMGSILAESAVSHRLEKNMAPLKDVFGAVFFVSIGMLIDPQVIWEQKGVIALLCLVVVGGKILSAGFGSLVAGQGFRNSVQVGLGLTQIGEFSFIIAQLGQSLRVTGELLYPIAVAVSLITTFTTPYLIRASGAIAIALERLLPDSARAVLNRYAVYAEAHRARRGEKSAYVKPILRWAINGLTVSVVFVFFAESVVPLLEEQLLQRVGELGAHLLGWGLAVFVSAPFVWAMLTAHRGELFSGPVRAIAGTVTLAWLGFLSAVFFPGRYVLLGAGLVFVVAFAVFYRRLERSYRWFEMQFLSTFKDKHLQELPTGAPKLHHLAPWDAHLVTLEIHPDSPLVLRRISEVAMRVRFGVNIVAIQRGKRSIVTPMPTELLLPGDHLVLLGTDEQVERVGAEFVAPLDVSDNAAGAASAHYDLRQVTLGASSALTGKTIRESGIRERYQAMVVGIERHGKRMINPDSDLALECEDVLWIAGEELKLRELVARIDTQLGP